MDAPTKRPLDETSGTPYCVPCSDMGQPVPARGFCQDCTENLCQACYSSHTKSSATETHRLQDDTASSTPGPAPEKAPRRSDGTLFCSEHPETSAAVFCMSHNIAVCDHCADDSHKPCCDTETISKMAPGFHTSREYQGLIELFESLDTKIEVLTEATSNTYLVKNEATKALLNTAKTECGQFRKNVCEHKSDLSKHRHNAYDLYVFAQKAIVSLRSIEIKVNHFMDQIHALHSDVAKQNTEAAEEPDATAEDAVHGSQGDDGSQDAPVLAPEQATELLSDEESLVNKERLISQLDAAVFEKQYDLKWKIPSEFNSNWCMKGIIFVQPDQLFLVDYNNSQLKRINTTTNKVTSAKLNDRPYDVTALPYTGGNRVVITLPWSDEIRFYEPTSKELKFDGYRKMHKLPLAISATSTMLVISYIYKPARLEVVDFTGKYQWTIAPDVDGKPLFINPAVVRVTKEKQAENVYVSDPDAKCVSRLFMNGVVLFVYRDPMLSDPRGLAITYGKQLLIASYRENCIHLVSHDGKKIRTLLGEADGIKRPLHVALSHAEHRVYISNDYGRGVLVYKIL